MLARIAYVYLSDIIKVHINNYVDIVSYTTQIISLSQIVIGQLTVGHIINLASNDIHKFEKVSIEM